MELYYRMCVKLPVGGCGAGPGPTAERDRDLFQTFRVDHTAGLLFEHWPTVVPRHTHVPTCSHTQSHKRGQEPVINHQTKFSPEDYLKHK